MSDGDFPGRLPVRATIPTTSSPAGRAY